MNSIEANIRSTKTKGELNSLRSKGIVPGIVYGGKMKSIEEHIQKDKEILADPKLSEPMRRHTLEELHELEVYVDHHHEEIEAGDHHDPNVLELFCEMHPDEPECLVYDD